MTRVKITEDNIFTWLSAGNWALLAAMTLVGLLFFSPGIAGSILSGGLLAIVNFYWLLSILKRVLQMPSDKANRFAQVRYVLRLAILAIVLWALIRFAGINIIALLLGLSITVVNIIALALYKVAHKGG